MEPAGFFERHARATSSASHESRNGSMAALITGTGMSQTTSLQYAVIIIRTCQ